jgi:hypothetical protein
VGVPRRGPRPTGSSRGTPSRMIPRPAGRPRIGSSSTKRHGGRGATTHARPTGVHPSRRARASVRAAAPPGRRGRSRLGGWQRRRGGRAPRRSFGGRRRRVRPRGDGRATDARVLGALTGRSGVGGCDGAEDLVRRSAAREWPGWQYRVPP